MGEWEPCSTKQGVGQAFVLPQYDKEPQNAILILKAPTLPQTMGYRATYNRLVTYYFGNCSPIVKPKDCNLNRSTQHSVSDEALAQSPCWHTGKATVPKSPQTLPSLPKP